MSSNPLSKQAQVLTQLLDDSLDEAERTLVEQRLLNDDAYYEQLLAAETELIDGYTGGDFSSDQEQSISHMISLSSNLQDKAVFSETINQWVSNREAPSDHKRWFWGIAMTIAAAILSLLGYLLVSQQQQIEQQNVQILEFEKNQAAMLDKQRQTEQALARLQLLYSDLERAADKIDE